MSGAAKRAFKTWLTFLIVLCVATGKAVEGCLPLQPTKAERVLVLELEGPEKLTARRWELLLAPFKDKLPPDSVWYSHRRPIMLDDPEWLGRICAFVKEKNIKLVIIDTLAKSHRGDENDARSVGDVMRAIDRIRHAGEGVTVIYLHHLRKPKEDAYSDIDDDIRGSTALQGFYDTHFAIRKRTAEQQWLDLTVRQNNAEEVYFQLRWTVDEQGGYASLAMQKIDGREINQEQLDNYLGFLMDGEQYSLATLAQAWAVPRDIAKNIRAKLLLDGRLVKLDNGKCQLMAR